MQWHLATMVAMNTNECQNIVSAIVVSFEKCNIALLKTKLLTQEHVEDDTIEHILSVIQQQSRSKILR